MKTTHRRVNRGRCVIHLSLLCLVICWVPSPVCSAEWSDTEVQLLYGNGFELGPAEREIITLQHASGWRYGSNFFFFDIVRPFASDTTIYGEWYSRFSLRRIAGKDRASGLLGDISASVAINAGNGFRAYLAGTTLHFNAPRFNFLMLDVMVYDDRAREGATYIVTPAWDLPFEIGRAKFRFRGFIDLIGAEGDFSWQLLTQPQLLIDVGSVWGDTGRFWAGVEYQYWKNKYGIENVQETVPQIMIMWRF